MHAVTNAVATSLLLGLGLAGCNDRSADPSLIDQYRADWHTLDDGSKYALVPMIGMDTLPPDRQSAARCWATTGPAVLCLDATKDSGRVTGLSLSISRHETLPDILFPSVGAPGYSCSASMGSVVEEIRREGALLTSNVIGPRSSPWSRSYVERYLQENDVEGQWFDCDRLLRIVHAGSLETISTTQIRRSMLPE